MPTDLFAVLELETNELRKRNKILVCKSDTDGSFIIHFYITAFIKGGFDVCVVGLSQSFVHFSSIASKLGINLTELKKNGRFHFLDCLKFMCDSCKHSAVTENNPFTDNGSEPLNLKGLYFLIQEEMHSVTGPLLLIIDDLNPLLNFGFQVGAVADFLHYVYQISECNKEPVTTLTTICHDTDVDDDDVAYLVYQAISYCDIAINIHGLTTGFSKDVHGQISIDWTQAYRDPTVPMKSKQMQYKVTDRNVIVFPRGTSAAVL